MNNTGGDPLRGMHTLRVALPLVAMKIFAPTNEGYGEAVNEFEAFGLDLAENSTAVYPDRKAGGSNCT
ncbi:hypothetical protein [Tunturiibacter gelidiferens]|uniref:hypothetical protein n=1 Tax=Tunturiibacter gelidiferens TaxID=3069689 RepID=UPI003D9AC525